MSKKVVINTEYITLGQLLKMENIIETGGLAKVFLSETEVLVNGIKEQRRGKKLFPGDIVNIKNLGSFI
ncbi:MAG TPA: S4 domain-containing protein YaaA, partial [Haloplasmataceae bacterium]